MTRQRVAGLFSSFAFVASLFLLLPRLGAEEKKDGSGGYRPLGLFTEVLTITRQNYVEPVDGRKLFAGAYAGVTDALDPVSEYVPPSRVAQFRAAEEVRGAAGAGSAGLVIARRFGYPVVVSAVAGGPAAAAGLKSDDVIEKVAGHTARGMALWEVEAHLTGRPGTKVRLLVVREGNAPRHRTIDVVLASWSPEGPSSARVEGQTVLRVPAFGEGTASALKATLAPLDPTRPLVVDVRGAAYGTWEEAARAASLFVPSGPLGQLVGRRVPARSFAAAPGERLHQGKVVVLVDSGTSGPGEFFAAVLRESAGRLRGESARAGMKPEATPTPADLGTDPKDGPKTDSKGPAAGDAPRRGRVQLVGEPTPGLATELKVVPLQSGGVLRLSVARVKTAGGRSLSPRGLEPDERVFEAPVEEGKAAVDGPLRRALKLLAENPAAS